MYLYASEALPRYHQWTRHAEGPMMSTSEVVIASLVNGQEPNSITQQSWQT